MQTTTQREIVFAVGSENAAKIRAVKTTVEKLFNPSSILIVKSCKANSKVRDQPMSDEESIEGARNRASFALKEHDADYGVGIESGVHKLADKWFTSCWCIVIDKHGKEGIGSSSRLEIPDKIMKYLLNGTELAIALEDITGKKDVRSNQGIMGLMTNGLLPRDVCETHGITFAFSPFISEKVYWEDV